MAATELGWLQAPQLLRWSRAGRIALLQRLQREYGDYVQLQLGRRRLLLVSDPAGIEHVLRGNFQNYRKSAALKRASILLGNGLLLTDGDFWRQQRRLMQPAFHRRRLVEMTDTMVATIDVLLQRWQQYAASGKAVDVSAEMMALTLDVVARAQFGKTVTAVETQQVRDALNYLFDLYRRRVVIPLPLIDRLPLPANLRALRAIKQLNQIIYRLIARRRAAGGEHHDLLELLLQATDDETGAGMRDRQVRDEVMTLFLAGHETTATLLSWALWLLDGDSDVRARLTAEVDRELDGRRPTFDDVGRLTYTRQVIDEALRLYPPGWIFGRTAIEDDVVAGHAVRRGDTVLMSPYVVQRSPQLWMDPDHFDPDRFAPANSEGRQQFAYWPFGGGPRLCIGRPFALLEATLVLALIHQRFRVEFAPQSPSPVASLTLRPPSPFLAVVRLREES